LIEWYKLELSSNEVDLEYLTLLLNKRQEFLFKLTLEKRIELMI